MSSATQQDTSNGETIQAKLAALAERQSKGQTTDAKALTKASVKNARLPAIPADAVAKNTKGGRGASSKKKKKNEKMKERALGTNEQLAVKVMQKDIRKSQRERAKRAWD